MLAHFERSSRLTVNLLSRRRLDAMMTSLTDLVLGEDMSVTLYEAMRREPRISYAKSEDLNRVFIRSILGGHQKDRIWRYKQDNKQITPTRLFAY